MKNVLFSLLFILTTGVLALAQGFYVQAGASYLGAADDEVLGAQVANALDASATVNGNILGSYGPGVGLDLNLGFMLGQNFGLDLGAEYVLGTKTLIEEFTNGDNYDRSYATNRRLTLSPAIILDAGNETFSPFARIGLVVPVAGSTNGLRESDNASLVIGGLASAVFPEGIDKFEAESVAKGQFTIGLTADVGLRFQLTESLSVLGSVGFTSLRVNRDTYEVTRAEVDLPDGTTQDVIPLLSLGGALVYTEYVEELGVEELAAYQAEIAAAGGVYGTADYPARETTIGANFSTIDFSIGLRYQLFKK